MGSRIRRCGAIAISALACGCNTLTRTSGPAPIPEEGTRLQAAAQVGPAYERYHAAGTDEGRRRLVRDEFIANRMGQLDVDFLAYVRSVSSSKRSLDAATEAAQLTLGVAATLVGGTQAKENLAAAIALITGGKATYDKHYFDNKGLDAVLSTMISRRKKCSCGSCRASAFRPLNTASCRRRPTWTTTTTLARWKAPM